MKINVKGNCIEDNNYYINQFVNQITFSLIIAQLIG